MLINNQIVLTKKEIIKLAWKLDAIDMRGKPYNLVHNYTMDHGSMACVVAYNRGKYGTNLMLYKLNHNNGYILQ